LVSRVCTIFARPVTVPQRFGVFLRHVLYFLRSGLVPASFLKVPPPPVLHCLNSTDPLATLCANWLIASARFDSFPLLAINLYVNFGKNERELFLVPVVPLLVSGISGLHCIRPGPIFRRGARFSSQVFAFGAI